VGDHKAQPGRWRAAREVTRKELALAMHTPLITGTDFIALGTTDFDRAVDFYANVLGLPERKRWGSMPGVEFETGNLTIAIMESKAFGLEFRPHPHPVEFRVDDVEAARRELESRGVEFQGDILDSGVCHQTFFTDPDGNALAIHHRYAPEPGAAAP
jgi:catechol 2,3-dioxygenase-like lactoylglutathione lyase family enzyme